MPPAFGKEFSIEPHIQNQPYFWLETISAEVNRQLLGSHAILRKGEFIGLDK
jgi:hypothetical protein